MASKAQVSSLGAPNKTLYITNLPSNKFRKTDLRTALYILFSSFGPVLDVVALLTSKMRGQAHIAFRDVGAATQALRSLQGFDFFGREMKIAYAKTESHVFGRLEGRAPAGLVGEGEQGKKALEGEGVTEAQRAVFGGAPGAATGGAKADEGAKGVKRARDEEEEQEDSDGDVEMEMDSDGDASMEEASDDE